MNKNKKPRMTKKDMETAKRLLKYVTEKYKLQFILIFLYSYQCSCDNCGIPFSSLPSG